VTADGRGEAAITHTRWLWLPADDGSVTVADPVDIPLDIQLDRAVDIPAADAPFAGATRRLRAVSTG
jgi:hypothetical protein